MLKKPSEEAMRNRLFFLPEDMRQILLLKADGYNRQQIANRLGKSISWVDLNLSRDNGLYDKLDVRYFNSDDQLQILKGYARLLRETEPENYPPPKPPVNPDAKNDDALDVKEANNLATISDVPTTPTQKSTPSTDSQKTKSDRNFDEPKNKSVTIERSAYPKTPPLLLTVAALILTALLVIFFIVNRNDSHTPSICGQALAQRIPEANRFIRQAGLSLYTNENTSSLLLNDKVRTLAVNELGLWIGHSATDTNPSTGVDLYNQSELTLTNCSDVSHTADKNINHILTDPLGRIWIATEKKGIEMFDGTTWKSYTTRLGLPSDEIYSIVLGPNNTIFATTWEGVARYNEEADYWTTVYEIIGEQETIFNNRVHALLPDSKGNIWIGHVEHGLSFYNNETSEWEHITANNNLAGNQIRFILAKPEENGGESVWIATADGGISQYENGNWTTYNIGNGLPSNGVTTLALDRYNRIWAGTDGGTVYFQNGEWILYHSYPTLAIAFGMECAACSLDSDHVWTGTLDRGLTHSKIPLPDVAIEVISIDHPKVVTPGETFNFTVTVRPRSPYQLVQERGDQLIFIEENNEHLFGMHPNIEVKGTTEAGQSFPITDHDNTMTAPQLPEGQDEQTFTSLWRVWMNGRYVGPVLPIEFTVRR